MPIDTFPLTDRVSTIRTLIPVTIGIFSPVFVFVIWNPYAISSVIFISNPGRCDHRSVRIESIFGTIDGKCTDVHSTICPKIIPDIIKLNPSCDHGTGRRVQIVITAVCIDPSGCSLTGGIHIIPGIIICNKLIRQRSGGVLKIIIIAIIIFFPSTANCRETILVINSDCGTINIANSYQTSSGWDVIG